MLEQMLIDVVMCFVGIDGVHKVPCALTKLLYVIQNPDSRVAHSKVNVACDCELVERLPSLVSLSICHHITPIVGFADGHCPAMPPDAIPANTVHLAIHCLENIS